VDDPSRSSTGARGGESHGEGWVILDDRGPTGDPNPSV
jgi:hypothetical protein